ncbi:hypothetical protein F0562_026723 [Nyssa sinensis]|uniref:Uncharacterized protein n=1 Tax=Nyssa sinensis TaxID=561372 RepID=A0A5J5BFT9_9ASTE|nr:hypothetical protein F0562_026723 [Nyssa sinensis]
MGTIFRDLRDPNICWSPCLSLHGDTSEFVDVYWSAQKAWLSSWEIPELEIAWNLLVVLQLRLDLEHMPPCLSLLFEPNDLPFYEATGATIYLRMTSYRFHSIKHIPDALIRTGSRKEER